MAKFNPEIDNIYYEKEIFKDVEIEFIEFLNKNLDNDFLIYLRPYIHSDNIKMLLVKKSSGIIIFDFMESKEFESKELIDLKEKKKAKINKQIEEIKVNEKESEKRASKIANLEEKIRNLKEEDILRDKYIIKMKEYKDNMFNIHLKDMAASLVKEPKMYSFVNIVIISDFDIDEQKNDDKKFNIFNIKKLNYETFNKYLEDHYFYKTSKYFNEKIFNNLLEYLDIVPLKFFDIVTNYSQKQQELIISNAQNQKIKGVAGSGKTQIIAELSKYELNKKKNIEILILCFNISIRNYIKKRLNRLMEGWEKNIEINHYHEFINSNMNNYEVEKEMGCFEDCNLFSGKEVKKYDLILIDEGQDFKYEWFEIIKKYFLKKDGKFRIFADEKQNIYEREQKEKNVTTNIVGNWNKLSFSYRQKNKLTTIVDNYKETFFFDKYELDKSETSVLFNLANKEGKYIWKKCEDMKDACEQILNIMLELKLRKEHFSILTLSNEAGIAIEEEILKKDQKTITTFESNGENEEIEKIRRQKRLFFTTEPERIKISTIHSFKGLEDKTIFLIIDEQKVKDEVLYVGITRAKEDLIIIDINSNSKHREFFSKFSFESGVSI